MTFKIISSVQEAILREKHSITQNIDNLIANYSNAKIYEKGPIIFLEATFFMITPTSYIIGKVIALCMAQWTPAILQKVKNQMSFYLQNHSPAKRHFVVGSIAAISIVILPKHLIHKIVSLATGAYYFQPPNHPKPTVILRRFW